MSFGKGTSYKSPQMMKKESAMKMKKNSPMDKPLVGNQKNLPEHLKQKIEAAPTKIAKGDAPSGKKVRKDAAKITKRKSRISKTVSEMGTGKGRKNSSDPFKMEKKSPMKDNHEGGILGKAADIAKKGMKAQLLKDNPPGSAGRKAAYDKLGWKYDDTVPGYNRDGSKKSTMTDPKKTDITGSDKNVMTKDYTTGSKKGRKTTIVKTEGDKTATLVDTKRNIGDKRVVNIMGPKGDVREKTKYDTAGDQTKKKRKMTLPDGTVVKVKSKRGGKRKVKIRKKGQLFSKRDRAREARLNEDLSMQPKN
jgi:hypothetical protein